MPSLSDFYSPLFASSLRGQRPNPLGLYNTTYTPWLAQHTREEPISFVQDDYQDLVTLTFPLPHNPQKSHHITLPRKIFCLYSLFFRSIFMPRPPLIPDPTPPYIYTLRKQFESARSIPFPCNTQGQYEAILIYFSWNTNRELKSCRQFAGIGSEDIHTRLEEYNRLWNQMIECYRLSHFLASAKFANIVMDTMILALREETTWQTRRRKAEDEDEEFGLRNPRSEQYQRVLERLEEIAENGGDNVLEQLNEGMNVNPGKRLLPPDQRHVLGGTPQQISKLYADTNPGSPLRKMIVDMIVEYSVKFPKYYGQNGGYGELLGGNETLVASGHADQSSVPMEFIQDLLSTFAKQGNKREEAKQWTENCKYHDHTNGGGGPCRVAANRAQAHAALTIGEATQV